MDFYLLGWIEILNEYGEAAVIVVEIIKPIAKGQALGQVKL